jgi:transcriptional regulator with XRE-family HTH domain
MKLKMWRHENKITQSSLAALIGVILVTVSRWECGTRMPSHRMQVAIHRLTGGAVSPNDWL